uniref:hydrogenase formation protein n=1 Tax=unclassified Variovorax TaxID=663243 RepID=UPI000D3C8C8C
MSPQPLAPWAGTLQLRPGRRRPHSLASTRRPLAGLLLAGQPVAQAPRMLASLFTLCGHAHALCATSALAAAQGRGMPDRAAARRALQLETARDHALRICLDWPAMPLAKEVALARAGAIQASLHGIRAWARHGAAPADAATAAAAAAEWLGHLLGAPPRAWLAAWERDRGAWLARWCAQGDGWLPALLRCCWPFAGDRLQAALPLRPHASPAGLRALLRDMAEGFDAAAPTWHGSCAETGTWTRLHDARATPPADAFERLGTRIAELARLVLPDAPGHSGGAWLATGAVCAGRGEGLAWVEMARGLLVHRARIDGPADAPRVAGYDVLAPTDWNFHPQGAVAQALEAMAADRVDTPARVSVLMAAYDPCVRFDVEAHPATLEPLHA